MALNEQPELLFFDTFSHDTSEELNLDLVQFPKSVYVREIRIIPLGARVEGDFPGGVRLGATNPTKFHIDFFVNDLSKPGASTFEGLGSIDYCQNGQIHMECGNNVERPRIPTDGLVLRGCYTTITLAVYGNLTQVISDTPVGANPPNVQRPSIPHEVPSGPPTTVPEEWHSEPSNPIPTYTSTATSNPEAYGSSYPPENYDNQIYENDYYGNDPPKDPRTYHHVEDNDWEKDRRAISREREEDRLRHSPRSIEHERDRRGRSRRSSLDRGRSRESSRHRERSRELERLERLNSRSRSRERDYVTKGEYRPLSRSRSRSLDRISDREWDRGSYKKDDYRRRREDSYERSRGGSYDKRSGSYDRRSPYSKRSPSYERKFPYEKRGPSYEKRLSPYDRRASSYERRAPSYEKQIHYDKIRHSPYNRVRTSSYNSRSPSRDDVRKRPRSPPGDISRRAISPREEVITSPIHSARSDDDGDYRSGNLIPRLEIYHESYRHKTTIRSPSEEMEHPPFVEQQHSSLVTVPIVDNPPPAPKSIESPIRAQEESIDIEQFEPILSDEDICDDLEGPSFTEDEYDVNEYGEIDEIIKYYNPFKTEWKKYDNVNKVQLLANIKKDGIKDVTNASFEELCDVEPDLIKISEMARKENQFSVTTFNQIENTAREEWVHLCEQLCMALKNLCKNTDILLRIFKDQFEPDDEFSDIFDLLLVYCKIGLNFDFALAQQQPTYKIRHMKCGIRLVESLFSHSHSGQVMKVILNARLNIPVMLLEMYSKEYMALSIRLMILKSLNACLSSEISMKHFIEEKIFPNLDKNESDNRKFVNGYQALINIMQNNPLARIKFSICSLIKKMNIYELLGKLRKIVLNFNNNAAESIKTEDSELSEDYIDFIVHSLEEILYMYRSECFYISQPKRFLPASAQFEISKDNCNEILLEFFSIQHILEVFIYLLTCPTTCNNLVLVSPIHDLLYELIYSFNGLKFLYKNIETSGLLFKILLQPYSQQNSEEFIYPHDLNNYSELQILGLELAYRLKTLYYLESICDLQAGDVDENDLIDRLQSLYCLSFGCIGKTAVPDVIVMEHNAECLMQVIERDLRCKNKNDSPFKQKSPAKGYAIELIASVVRFSANVPFFKKYGQRLINLAKGHDKFEPSVSCIVQEIITYLKPIEKASLTNGDDMVECIEILKTYIEHAPDLPGELVTCLRILQYFCISDYEIKVPIACESATEEYVQLKFKYNVLQLFSFDGIAHLIGILDRLTTHFEQPSMHTAFLASVKGLQLAQIILPCLRLLDEMLARVVRCRGSRFRDLTATPILLKTYGLVKAFPVGSVGYRTAAKATEAAVRTLLAYAQPIADDANDGDSIRRGPWTSLCSEVISYTMTAPYTFVSGLLVFSELLPLPLPIQSKTSPTKRELEDASNERKMWSAHLHALSSDLTDMIQVICMSTYRPVVHMLRRVCVQIADLAPNTAATVAKAAVGTILRELKSEEPATASSARVLGFLACLVSHAPVKCAVLYTMNGSGTKATDLQKAICSVLSISSNSSEHGTAQEFAAHILAALCDAEISLTPLTAATESILANSLPNKETLGTMLDSSADCLESSTKSSAVASSVLRAYFVLTEHEYGFHQFKKFVSRRRESLGKFFKWCLDGSGDDKVECLNLYVDLIRILTVEEGEGALGRKSVLNLSEIADMVGYSTTEEDHPALTLEKILKERGSDEDAIVNANFLKNHLQSVKNMQDPATPPLEIPETVLPPPESLVAQFQTRVIYSLGDANDERLTTSYWLNVPSASGEEHANHNELVPCDILDVANTYLSCSGGAESIAGAVRRLVGVPGGAGGDLRPSGDDRTMSVHTVCRVKVGMNTAVSSVPPSSVVGVGVGGVRGEGGADAFRSRPPNTSRPPSLHVDDFTALHQYRPNRQPRRGGGGGAGVGGDRGRFVGPHPHQHPHVHPHYRHLRGRGAWEMGAQHFGHFPPGPGPANQYMMGGMGWGGGRMQRGPRHRTFMR